MHGEKLATIDRIGVLDGLEGENLWNINAENERRELKAKLLQILEREERAVQMKNKFTWAKDGDANTKLFHLLLSA